ncbi:inositol monophosphatase family protein [Leifsonia sp. L25]|uniref:inositol monophosphatase family protein n=1 Tax=Leifsonia sp. L25 TaxID=3423957 RepID=UPI003D688760
MSGFLGEESGGGSSQSGLTWVVDPIDGTVNYFYGIPAWAVSIAVVEGDPDPATWRTLAGAVVNPVCSRRCSPLPRGRRAAERGAHPRERGRRPEPRPGRDGIRVTTPRCAGARPRLRRRAHPRGARHPLHQGRIPRPLLARRRPSSTRAYERRLNPWDHAAGALIAQEAGARVAGIAGGPADRRLLVAAAPDLFDRLHPRVERFYSDWE